MVAIHNTTRFLKFVTPSLPPLPPFPRHPRMDPFQLINAFDTLVLIKTWKNVIVVKCNPFISICSSFSYLSATWLPHGQLWATVQRGSLTNPTLKTAFDAYLNRRSRLSCTHHFNLLCIIKTIFWLQLQINQNK